MCVITEEQSRRPPSLAQCEAIKLLSHCLLRHIQGKYTAVLSKWPRLAIISEIFLARQKSELAEVGSILQPYFAWMYSYPHLNDSWREMIFQHTSWSHFHNSVNHKRVALDGVCFKAGTPSSKFSRADVNCLSWLKSFLASFQIMKIGKFHLHLLYVWCHRWSKME